MADVFTTFSIYPQAKDQTLLEWDLNAQFTEATPYTFTVQFSRSGNPTGDDWIDIGTVIDEFLTLYTFTDAHQRSYASNEEEFYRVKLVTADGNTYYSNVSAAWGSLDRNDRLKLREMYRQECLRMQKKAGINGLLIKRRHWGQTSTDATVVDPDTKEVIDPRASATLGTHFVGGYYKPIQYWVEMMVNVNQRIKTGETGMDDTTIESVRGLAWPMPRSLDIWCNCTSGTRYQIEDATIVTRIRHIPVTLTIRMRELPKTDIAYEIDIDG